MFQEDSSFCPLCHYAYDASLLKWWCLTLEDRDGFKLQLNQSIYEFPVVDKTESRVVYSQQFITIDSIRHSLSFWCETDRAYFEEIRAYAGAKGLGLEIEVNRLENLSSVMVETMTMKELNAPRIRRLEELDLQKAN